MLRLSYTGFGTAAIDAIVRGGQLDGLRELALEADPPAALGAPVRGTTRGTARGSARSRAQALLWYDGDRYCDDDCAKAARRDSVHAAGRR